MTLEVDCIEVGACDEETADEGTLRLKGESFLEEATEAGEAAAVEG